MLWRGLRGSRVPDSGRRVDITPDHLAFRIRLRFAREILSCASRIRSVLGYAVQAAALARHVRSSCPRACHVYPMDAPVIYKETLLIRR